MTSDDIRSQQTEKVSAALCTYVQFEDEATYHIIYFVHLTPSKHELEHSHVVILGDGLTDQSQPQTYGK